MNGSKVDAIHHVIGQEVLPSLMGPAKGHRIHPARVPGIAWIAAFNSVTLASARQPDMDCVPRCKATYIKVLNGLNWSVLGSFALLYNLHCAR